MMTADDPHGYHARCAPHLATLAALARGPAGAPLPPGTAAKVAEAAGAVLTEAQAAGHAAATSTAGEQAQTAEFLAARLARLATAATAAVTAARNADAAALRRELRQFDTLTTALWTVHRDIAVPARRQPATFPPQAARNDAPA